MKSREFVYWLQGMFELNPSASLDAIQTQKIKNHLALVFKHEIDPEGGDAKTQEELNKIHSGVNPHDMMLRC